MLDPKETAALVALLRAGRRPWSHYAERVEETGSALRVLEEALNEGSAQTHLFAAADPLNEPLEPLVDEIDAWRMDGINLVTVLDPDYPENLRAVHDRPPLVFVAGALSPSDSRSIAVVGTRVATAVGLADASEIARHFAEAGYSVLSGLAAGIDTAVHNSALACGGRTIAVVGTGLRRSYPAQNAALQRRIAAEHAVISQFWPEAAPTKRSFPMRNAVMSGVSLATVVVEASHTSGSRIQARLALAQGRPVFLWHSLLREEWARAFATRPGTHVVHSAGEITTVLERLTCMGALIA